MKEEKDKVSKVYSPDIIPYSFEGESYFFGTVLSFLVAPIRIVTRVTHNIFILPAQLQEGYANTLLLISGVLLGIGVVDVIFANKWPLLVSECIVLIYALWLRRNAHNSVKVFGAKREVALDEDAISEVCSEVYDDLNKIIGSEEE